MAGVKKGKQRGRKPEPVATPKRRGRPSKPKAEPKEVESEVESEVEQEADAEDDEGEPEVVTLTLEQKQEAFEALDAITAELKKRKEGVEAQEEYLGEHLREMIATMGTGPFRWKGRLLTLVVRGRSARPFVQELSEEKL